MPDRIHRKPGFFLTGSHAAIECSKPQEQAEACAALLDCPCDNPNRCMTTNNTRCFSELAVEGCCAGAVLQLSATEDHGTVHQLLVDDSL